MIKRRLSNRELNEAAKHYDGPYRPYDIVKEVCVATGVVMLIAVILTILFSSPDLPPSTIASWSRTMPIDFVTTAVTELDGTSETATYGPPYNHESGSVQHIAFIKLQQWLGVSHPINAPYDFVIQPLRMVPDDPALQSAVSAYKHAPAKTQNAWTTAYSNALGKASAKQDGPLSVPAGNYGPVAPMMSALLALAQSGGLDGDLLTSSQFYQTDFTKPLLLLEDGNALNDRATYQHLQGEQWGMMNETGSYPGQVWLWLYTFWYQVSPLSSSANVDALVMAIMGVLSVGLILVPFLPGIRSIPRRIPVYKLIWRDWYSTAGAKNVPPASGSAASPPPS
ncbi:MAG TPA: hypothetical protein VHM72_04230 [Solirubrobacteraceae bacterium]|nr:hypothetical protein [Solirubrobacteraceae bacterium]